MEYNLTLPQLKEYLRNVKNLEVSCYQQQKVIERLKEQPNKIMRDIAALQNSEKPPEKPSLLITDIFMGIIVCIPYGLYGLIWGAIVGFILRFVVKAIKNEPVKIWPFIMWGAIIGFVVVFLIFLIHVIIDGRKKKSEYPEQVQDFKKKQEVNKSIITRKQKQLSDIPKEILACEQKYADTKLLLDEYYKLGYVYPNYRGIVPICTIYQYFDSGRCTALTGHEGAYNLYESELRMNMILGKLDTILEKLDEISNNQLVLAQELRRSNEKIEGISYSLDQIEESTALAQYYSGVTVANTTYLAWLNTFQYVESRK